MFKSLISRECVSCAGVIIGPRDGSPYILLLSVLNKPSTFKHFRFYFEHKEGQTELENDDEFSLTNLIFDINSVMMNRLNQVKIKGSIYFHGTNFNCEDLLLVIENEEIISKNPNNSSDQMIQLPCKKIISLNNENNNTYLLEKHFQELTNFFMKNEHEENLVRRGLFEYY